MTRRYSVQDLALLKSDLGAKLPEPKARKKRDNEESRIQKSIVAWWRNAAAGFRVPQSLFYSVPNGAHLGGAAQARAIKISILKAEGLAVGWPDLNLDVARNGYHGLRIECKKPGARPGPEQLAIHAELRAQGYDVCSCCDSLELGIKVITDYLS